MGLGYGVTRLWDKREQKYPTSKIYMIILSYELKKLDSFGHSTPRVIFVELHSVL